MAEIRFDLREVRANPMWATLQPGIQVSFRVRWTGPPCVINDFRGRLELRGQGSGKAEPLIAEGTAWMDRAFETRDGQEMSGQLDFLLPFGILDALEERRGDSRLSLGLKVHALGTLSPKSSNEHATAVRAEASASLLVEKSAWVEEFLPAYGFGDAQFVEFRFPRLATPVVLKRELELLMEARSDYNSGDYDDCFTDLRKMKERLGDRFKDLSLDGALDPKLFGRAQDMLSVALHENKGLDVRVNRADATMALMMGAAVYRRVAEAVVRAERMKTASA